MHNNKPSIVQVINSTQIGGGMGHLLNLFRHLDRKRYHLALVADRGTYLVDAIRELGIPIHFLPLMRSRIDPSLAIRLARIANREGADLLHCHGTRAAFYGALARPLCRAGRSVYTVHGFSFHKSMRWPASLLFRLAEKMHGKTHDRLISVSEADRLEAIEQGVCPAESIRTIPNAIDFDSFDPAKTNGQFRFGLGISPKTRLVGTAARLVPQKGIGVFLSAASMIHARRSDVRFVVVGSGSLATNLKVLAEKEGLSGVIDFPGPSDRMNEVYAGIDVFVLASLWEGHPLSLIEALAMEKPTVATYASGCPEILEEGKCGLLVPPGDPRSLAAAVLRLLDEPGFARELAQRGRRSVLARYSIEAMAKQTEEVYTELLATGISSNPVWRSP